MKLDDSSFRTLRPLAWVEWMQSLVAHLDHGKSLGHYTEVTYAFPACAAWRGLCRGLRGGGLSRLR